MTPLILTWMIATAFAVLAFWGSNVPTARRSIAVVWIVAVLVVYNIIAQSYFFRGLSSQSQSAAVLYAEKLAKLETFLASQGLLPGYLRGASLKEWYRIITSTLMHFGWLHLLINAWFFVLFGHVLEQKLGVKKFLTIVAAGLFIPATLDGLMTFRFGNSLSYTGGFGGVVYATMGAYIVCFPKSRFYGALNYDLRFWGAIFFIILPVTMVTRFAGMTLTEVVMITGMLGFFLLIQPEHARVSAAASVVILYKLLIDILLLQPLVGHVLTNSLWRIAGGFVVGVTAGLLLNGVKGWSQVWEDEAKALPPTSGARTRMSLAQLEAEGHKSPEAARAFLGQRVFIGDTTRATAFFRDVVIPKFPDLILPLQEQMALARLLHFKGHEKEALHAYETLLRHTSSLPDEYWIAWLKAAELAAKVDPKRKSDICTYLDRFAQGNNIMMRDRIEAERLRATLGDADSVTPADGMAAWPLINSSDAELENHDAVRSDTDDAAEKYPGLKRRLSRCRQVHTPQPLQFPKSSPRTFTFRGGEVLATRPPKEAKLEAVESPADVLTHHWKPLPCIAKEKPVATSVLDRPVKNPQTATDDEQKQSMYGGLRPGRTDTGKKQGRLSRLEVIRKDLKHTPPAAESAPAQYGGLDEHADSGARPHQGFRLRGEKDSNQIERQRLRQRKSGETDLQWERRLKPADHVPSDASKYGVKPQQDDQDSSD